MKQHGKLIALCGKMGSGKSTQAALLAEEKNAVLISEDDWLSTHFPGQINTFNDYLEKSRLVRPFVKSLIQSILCAGANVVMDFPANTVSQRKWFRVTTDEIAAPLELIYLNTEEALCLKRVLERRKELPERAIFDNEDTFRQVTAFFEEPSEAEGIKIRRIDTQISD
jgi:adenylate kinase family enzyme